MWLYPTFVIFRFSKWNSETPTTGRILKVYSKLDQFLPPDVANQLVAARSMLWGDRKREQ